MADKIYCNVCGRELKCGSENGILMEDAFFAKKEWGYFSNKDMVRHSFLICEACYDDMVSGFAIPPEVEEVTEL